MATKIKVNFINKLINFFFYYFRVLGHLFCTFFFYIFFTTIVALPLLKCVPIIILVKKADLLVKPVIYFAVTSKLPHVCVFQHN